MTGLGAYEKVWYLRVWRVILILLLLYILTVIHGCVMYNIRTLKNRTLACIILRKFANLRMESLEEP
jgi:hypothetical protein